MPFQTAAQSDPARPADPASAGAESGCHQHQVCDRRPLRGLYAARYRGDLQGVCALFSPDARFEIAAASQGNPIAVNSHGAGEYSSSADALDENFPNH